MADKIRCFGDTPLYADYHDNEWGREVHDDRTLFEMLNLEGAQAGLSWITILKKRENYRLAFDNFDPYVIANYDQAKIEQLLSNAGIVRNRLKIQAVITNARAYIQLVKTHGSLNEFLWRYVDFRQIKNNNHTFADMPSRSPLSDQISRDLKRLGFKFVGSTIIYSFLQAVGIIDDHLLSCHCRHPQQ